MTPNILCSNYTTKSGLSGTNLAKLHKGEATRDLYVNLYNGKKEKEAPHRRGINQEIRRRQDGRF